MTERPTRPATNSIEESTNAEQTEEGGFLHRWSRRKEAARQSEREPDPTDGTAVVGPAAAPGAQQNDPIELAAVPAVEEAVLPSLDELDENSDYRGFFSPKVGEELRRLALRKLFHTPGFNVKDGLDDYDDDYRFFEALGDTITADMRHHLERQARQMTAEGERSATARGIGAPEPATDESQARAAVQVASSEARDAPPPRDEADDDAASPAAEDSP